MALSGMVKMELNVNVKAKVKTKFLIKVRMKLKDVNKHLRLEEIGLEA